MNEQQWRQLAEAGDGAGMIDLAREMYGDVTMTVTLALMTFTAHLYQEGYAITLGEKGGRRPALLPDGRHYGELIAHFQAASGLLGERQHG